MKQYIGLCETFAQMAGYATTRLTDQETDLVHLENGEELLVVFSNRGDEDLFIIFEDKQVTMTFGQWATTLYGNTLHDFEQLIDLLRGILEGEYVVTELLAEPFSISMLVNHTDGEVLSIFAQENETTLKSISAWDFFQLLKGRNLNLLTTSFVRDEEAEEDFDPDEHEMYGLEEEEDEQNAFEEHHHHHEGCGCSHHEKMDSGHLEQSICHDPDCSAHHEH